MRVIKVLNNSLVLALDDEGRETILMGKGIGFHKAAGYEFHKDEVEKVFVLKDRSISRSIIRLAAEIDSVYFEIVKSVIDYAISKYHMKLMDHIYLSLTDHIAFAVRRVREGTLLPNFYTRDMQKYNPDEFEIGKYALRLVEDQLGIVLPVDEAGNIAFHFINAQIDHPFNETNLRITQLTEDVLNLVKYYYRIEYDESCVTYTRFATHVRLFAQRFVANQQLPEDANRLLYDQIAPVCTSEFACVDRINRFVQERFGVSLTNQEALFLVVHIHCVLEQGVR